MTEVARQRKAAHRGAASGLFADSMPGIVSTAVVDQHDLVVRPVRPHDRANRRYEAFDIPPFVVHGSDHAHDRLLGHRPQVAQLTCGATSSTAARHSPERTG